MMLPRNIEKWKPEWKTWYIRDHDHVIKSTARICQKNNSNNHGIRYSFNGIGDEENDINFQLNWF